MNVNLKKYKVSCNIVSTPKELGGKCGVSVLFSFNDLIKAKHCKNSGQYSTFVNFYLLEVLNNFKRFVIV